MVQEFGQGSETAYVTFADLVDYYRESKDAYGNRHYSHTKYNDIEVKFTINGIALTNPEPVSECVQRSKDVVMETWSVTTKKKLIYRFIYHFDKTESKTIIEKKSLFKKEPRTITYGRLVVGYEVTSTDAFDRKRYPNLKGTVVCDIMPGDRYIEFNREHCFDQ